MCTPVFIAALFIIARTWKQPRCPLADEWIRKLWYIYTMEYYSAIKKNSFESVLMSLLVFKTTCLELLLCNYHVHSGLKKPSCVSIQEDSKNCLDSCCLILFYGYKIIICYQNSKIL